MCMVWNFLNSDIIDDLFILVWLPQKTLEEI